jgi:hypothetical protein
MLISESNVTPNRQASLFGELPEETSKKKSSSSTFVNNMGLPVHRWFRYSAGFSAEWVQAVLADESNNGPVRVFDPFAGSATTLLVAERLGMESFGLEAHPFVFRVARAKLAWRTSREEYWAKIKALEDAAKTSVPDIEQYPTLIKKCYSEAALADLDKLRQGFERVRDTTPASELVWLTLVSILRRVSHAGTAQWQYVLPTKQKKQAVGVMKGFAQTAAMIYADMGADSQVSTPAPHLLLGDARTCESVPKGFANFVITSPPYPNNYDYADATRLEMSFMREINGWGDLQETVRKFLVRSCSQHVTEKTVDLAAVLAAPELEPIRGELEAVCKQLAAIRETKGGKKNYHLMIACYFRDLAQVWRSLRNACATPSKVCFVIGDSAPYGIYVPVVPWMEALAVAAGFTVLNFEKTRDRNVKWKNRKHRVPLLEGRLWVQG